jgi:hypothetical protein
VETGKRGGFKNLFRYLADGAAEEARRLAAETMGIRIPKDVVTALNRFRDFQGFLEAMSAGLEHREAVAAALGRAAAGTAQRIIVAAREGEAWLAQVVKLYNGRIESRPGRFKETTVEALVKAARAYAEHGSLKVTSIDDTVGPGGVGGLTVLESLSEVLPAGGKPQDELFYWLQAMEAGRDLEGWDGLFADGSLEARILARLPEQFPDYMSYVYLLASMDGEVLELLSRTGRLKAVADLDEMRDILNDRKEFLLTSRKEERREAAANLFYSLAVQARVRTEIAEGAAAPEPEPLAKESADLGEEPLILAEYMPGFEPLADRIFGSGEEEAALALPEPKPMEQPRARHDAETSDEAGEWDMESIVTHERPAPGAEPGPAGLPDQTHEGGESAEAEAVGGHGAVKPPAGKPEEDRRLQRKQGLPRPPVIASRIPCREDDYPRYFKVHSEEQEMTEKFMPENGEGAIVFKDLILSSRPAVECPSPALAQLRLDQYRRRWGERLERDKTGIVMNFMRNLQPRAIAVKAKARKAEGLDPSRAGLLKLTKADADWVSQEYWKISREYPSLQRLAWGLPLPKRGGAAIPVDTDKTVDEVKERIFLLDAYLAGQESQVATELRYAENPEEKALADAILDPVNWDDRDADEDVQ